MEPKSILYGNTLELNPAIRLLYNDQLVRQNMQKMEESSVEIPPYITEAYLLFTQEALDRIVSEIPLLEVAPDYTFRSSLINEGMVYKGDPFYLLHVFYDKIVT